VLSQEALRRDVLESMQRKVNFYDAARVAVAESKKSLVVGAHVGYFHELDCKE